MKSTHPKVIFWKRIAMVSAVLTIVPALLGVIFTVLGMVESFDTLAEDGGNPEELASGISGSMNSMTIGLLVSILFSFCLIGSAIRLVVLSKQP